MKNTPTATLVSALRVLSVDVQSVDGVANAVLAEAADRMTLMANLVAQHIEETREDTAQMEIASAQMVSATATIQSLRADIKQLQDWKESALAVEREWNANAISTMLGGKPGESQREVIQREVPKLLARTKRLEEAGDKLLTVMRGEEAAAYCEWIGLAYDAEQTWTKAKENKS